MSQTLQWIIVSLVVLAALCFIISRMIKRREDSPNTSECSDCPIKNKCSKDVKINRDSR